MSKDKYILIDAWFLRDERVIEFIKKAKKSNLKVCVANYPSGYAAGIAAKGWEKRCYADTRHYCINPVEEKLNIKVVDYVCIARTKILSLQVAVTIKNCVLILSKSHYFNRKIMNDRILKSIKILNYSKNNWEKRSNLFFKNIQDENL